MQDFDIERAARALVGAEQREFKIGGEVFVRRVSVRPEALIEWEDMPSDISAGDALDITDRTLLAFIEDVDGAHERYHKMRANEADPVTVADMASVLKWLISESTGRPTVARSHSTDGRAVTKAPTPLTDDSPSPEEIAPGVAA